MTALNLNSMERRRELANAQIKRHFEVKALRNLSLHANVVMSSLANDMLANYQVFEPPAEVIDLAQLRGISVEQLLVQTQADMSHVARLVEMESLYQAVKNAKTPDELDKITRGLEQ